MTKEWMRARGIPHHPLYILALVQGICSSISFNLYVKNERWLATLIINKKDCHFYLPKSSFLVTKGFLDSGYPYNT